MEKDNEETSKMFYFSDNFVLDDATSQSTNDDQETPEILDPNHPMLAKFQQTLNDHLQKQIEHLSAEVFEMETGAKKQNSVKEQLGVETYEAQQQVNKQQDTIQLLVKGLQQISDTREHLEEQLQVTKVKHHQKEHELFERQRNELQLRNEFEGLSMLIGKLESFEEDVESELTVNQRVLEKTKKDRAQLTQEKRNLDLTVYRLMTEIFRIEGELETMDMQMRVKELEREKLAEGVANSNVEIDAINDEIKHLMNQWNTVLNSISLRDKNMFELRKDYDIIIEKIQSTKCETEKTMKLSKIEMEENEKLTVFLSRINELIGNCEVQLELENSKKDGFDNQIYRDQLIIDQIEKDIKMMQIENAVNKNHLNVIVKEFETLAQKKVALEEEILRTLEEKITNTKAELYLAKFVREAQDKTRESEITLARLEKQLAKLMMDIEIQKGLNEETGRYVDVLVQQRDEIELEGNKYAEELERLIYTTSKRQREVNILNMRIENIVSRTGVESMSPLEIKIRSLEKSIEETKDANKELQSFWLRQQSIVLDLSEQRQKQLKDMTKLKKQKLLIDQKNLRIGDDLNNSKKQIELRNRAIASLQNLLLLQNDKLCKTRENKDSLDQNNCFLQSDYLGKLEDSEMDILRLECDIKTIEQEKTTLSDDLIEENREALVWDKKIKMAVETKRNMQKERGEGGEVGNMKAEIHRMHVRLIQLKRAQDKLVADLEHCISRRDAILTGTEAREKRFVGQTEKTRVNFQRKMDDMRNTIKQSENEIVKIRDEIHDVEVERKNQKKSIELMMENTKEITEQKCATDDGIEQLKTDKQKNLEVLLLKQRKLNLYMDVAKKRNPFLAYRTESVISIELSKQQNLNEKLLFVITSLREDFPHFHHDLIRIHNTLIVPTLYI